MSPIYLQRAYANPGQISDSPNKATECENSCEPSSEGDTHLASEKLSPPHVNHKAAASTLVSNMDVPAVVGTSECVRTEPSICVEAVDQLGRPQGA